MPDYDPRIVDLYDIDNPDGPDHDFYRALADDRGAHAVLDLGCGTGLLTVTLAGAGSGAGSGRRVVGVDPSPAMLAFARSRRGADRVEWILGDSSAAPAGPFDLVVLTGNVVQHISDVDWSRTLRDLRARLRPGGTLAFESRDPRAREWERWSVEVPARRATPHGALDEWMDVEVIDERRVRLRAHNRFVATGETVVETLTLVFRSRAEIEASLRDAGFAVEAVHGDWAGGSLHPAARMIIVVARAV